ncbi:MAG TPA: Ltp family lipoprotein [Streptosporangiaceae bacterium]|jgi:hypothetical protein
MNAPSPSPVRPVRRHTLRNVLLAGGIGLVAIVAITATLSGGKPAGHPAVYHTPSVSIPAQSAPPAAQVITDPTGGKCTTDQVVSGYCPGDAPQYTASQQQAIDAAKNYISDGQGFSAYSLLNQLTSSFGNGFTQADAQFAISKIAPDWNQQAADAAHNYMSDGQGFSCSSLLDQLTSQYGNGFTHDQAEYGVQSVGLGSC